MDLDSMASLPLDAPVLAIERLRVEPDYVRTFNQAATKPTQLLEDSHSFKVIRGWRCDAPAGKPRGASFQRMGQRARSYQLYQRAREP